MRWHPPLVERPYTSPHKIKIYMDIAHATGKNSTCPRAKVGAVLVRNNRVVSLGYNGSPRGTPHCKDVGCELVKINGMTHCIRAVHAEQNAVANAAFMGVSTEGSTLFCTHSPCIHCSKLVINAGIVEIFYDKYYVDKLAEKLWALTGLAVYDRKVYERAQ